jgi:hypothetical protein
MSSSRFSKLRRWPALHFALLGGALFVFQTRVLAPADGTAGIPAREPIVVTAERIERIRSDYQRDTGSVPGAGIVRALIENWITDEILYREARAKGLDRADRAIKWRLAEKMRFIADDPNASPDELYREALDLGLDRDDLVVRRILVQKMRLLTRTAITRADFDESDLQEFFTKHQADYMQPPRATLSHVFLSNDKRGVAVEQDARRLLEELRSRAVPPNPGSELGDPFPLGHEYRESSARNLQKIFGADFAKQVFELKAHEWSGPIRSAYGLHLIWIDAIEPEKVPPFDAVRSRVEQRFLSERREQHVEETMQRLRQQYGVRIDGTV